MGMVSSSGHGDERGDSSPGAQGQGNRRGSKSLGPRGPDCPSARAQQPEFACHTALHPHIYSLDIGASHAPPSSHPNAPVHRQHAQQQQTPAHPHCPPRPPHPLLHGHTVASTHISLHHHFCTHAKVSTNTCISPPRVLTHPHTLTSLQLACKHSMHSHTQNTHRQVLWIHWNKGQFLVTWPTHRNSLDTLPFTGPHPLLPPPFQSLVRTLSMTAANDSSRRNWLLLSSTPDWEVERRGGERTRRSRAETCLPPSGVSLFFTGLIPSCLCSHLRGHPGNQMKCQAQGRGSEPQRQSRQVPRACGRRASEAAD